ncbi:hypothetical protein GCM10027167_49090 [Nocardia heshunensis]
MGKPGNKGSRTQAIGGRIGLEIADSSQPAETGNFPPNGQSGKRFHFDRFGTLQAKSVHATATKSEAEPTGRHDECGLREHRTYTTSFKINSGPVTAPIINIM